MKKISKIPQKLIITATMLVTITGAFTGCSTAKPATAPRQGGGGAQRQMAVETQIVKMADVGGGQVFTGAITPGFTTNISSKLTGKITDILVSVGDRVKVGQPLAKVDISALQQQIATSQIALALSETQLNRTKNDQANTVASAEKNLNSQQIQFEKTVSDQNNAIAVAKQAVTVSQAQLNNAVNTQQNSIATAKQALTSAQAAFNKSVNDSALSLANAQNTLSFQKDNLQTSSVNSLATLQSNLQQALSSYQITQNTYNTSPTANNKASVDSALSKLQTAQSALDQAQQTPLSNLSSNMKSLLDAQAALTGAQNSQTVQVAQESLNEKLIALANAQATTTEVNQQQLQQNQLALANAQATAQATINSSKAQLSVTEQALQTAKSTDAISVSKAQYEQAQANLKALTDQLPDGTIVSPVEGVVSTINTPVGQNAGGQGTVVTIVSIDPISATVNISETNIGKIKLGLVMNVKIPTLDKSYDGKVVSIRPTLDSVTKSYGVEIQIDDPKHEIMPGMFATSSLKSEGRKAILIPADAVLSQPSGNAAFIVKDGKAKKVTVKTGTLTSAQFEIISGLNEGDELVIKGQELLSDKVAVAVQVPGQETTTPAAAGAGGAGAAGRAQQGGGAAGQQGQRPQGANGQGTQQPSASPNGTNKQAPKASDGKQGTVQPSTSPSATPAQAPKAGGGQ